MSSVARDRRTVPKVLPGKKLDAVRPQANTRKSCRDAARRQDRALRGTEAGLRCECEFALAFAERLRLGEGSTAVVLPRGVCADAVLFPNASAPRVWPASFAPAPTR